MLECTFSKFYEIGAIEVISEEFTHSLFHFIPYFFSFNNFPFIAFFEVYFSFFLGKLDFLFIFFSFWTWSFFFFYRARFFFLVVLLLFREILIDIG